MEMKMFFPLHQLPDTVLEQILMMFSYHEISRLRRVNKRFNIMCMALLNKGFKSAENHLRKYLKDTSVYHQKSKLFAVIGSEIKRPMTRWIYHLKEQPIGTIILIPYLG